MSIILKAGWMGGVYFLLKKMDFFWPISLAIVNKEFFSSKIDFFFRMEDYLVLGRVGEGAHGIVMKCRHKISGQVPWWF